MFIYTLGLKRRTASNIVIRERARSFPVLLDGRRTGRAASPQVFLFAVIFFWTPPHFWALAMKFRDDYAAAGVPMLPVVAPAAVVARKIVLLFLCDGRRHAGPGAVRGLGHALLRGRAWRRVLAEAHRLRSRVARLRGGAPPGPLRSPPRALPPGVTEGTCGGLARPDANPAPMRLFHLSIAYLSLLFAAGRRHLGAALGPLVGRGPTAQVEMSG